jgi:serine/threonine protein kinase
VNYPSRTAIVNSVKYPALIKDEFFKGGILTLLPNGKPKCWSGGFSMVFQIRQHGTLYSFKIWHTELAENAKRYYVIREKLISCGLPYFPKFEYVLKGMLVDGNAMDTHRMEWVNGKPLKEYIYDHLHESKKLLDLAARFQAMVFDFHKFNIAHGDLQHGNIIVQPDGSLVVIDFDSMFVESLDGMPDLIKGQGGYQHPGRYYNQEIHHKIDYFSELVIYISLIVYADHPNLYNPETDWLLFSKEDLESPDTSEIFKLLKTSANPKISIMMSTLHGFLRCEDISQLLPLESILKSKIKTSIPLINNITNKF